MKVLYFGGGLGNQIFEYAFYLTIKDKFPKEKIHCVFLDKKFKEHASGFEIEKVFDIKFPPSSHVGQILMYVIMGWNKYIRKTEKYCHNLTKPYYGATLFNAFKMNFSFYDNRKDWIRFKAVELNEKNIEVVKLMQSCDSVALHVRRGDYLSLKYAAKHAGIATETYYRNAVKHVEGKVGNPHFFVFSDDIPWCKEHLNLVNVTYVDWNTGDKSYIDMYLMTQVKINIIANSTFSYWGAYFNNNNKLTIYPELWRYKQGDLNIFPSSWIALKSE